ncbi:MAG TPA: tRNA lysidine(34) synthetase TilS [Verrucomicrobiae bacterium]|nr:tRNA lysidine(34) synthetase TilS [Verrucomicrobiae bacterium]
MRDCIQRLEAEIRNRSLLKRGEKFLVAVSGGVDSMVLLRALGELSAKHQWKIVVAHFNHHLRGRASDADERLVRKTAAAMKCSLAVGNADVKAFAAREKLSLEMAGRKLRHGFLAEAAQKRKIKTIMLAHHADDQVELFFLRLLRGTGGEGLAGMKWRSPSPADGRVTLVRPLLGFFKNELLEYARENNIQFREDATNFSPDFLRNRIRNELLPLLRKQYQPALDKTVLRLMEIIGAEAEFAGEAATTAASILRLDHVRRPAERRIFDSLPVALQRRVLQSQLADTNVASDFDLIETLRTKADRFVSVGQDVSVARNAGGKIVFREETNRGFNQGERTVKVGRAGEADFGRSHFHWRLELARRFQRPRGMDGAEFFDADKVGDEIVLRHWRSGDRFQPIGMGSSAKLQNLFTNAKIPRERRRTLVLAATAQGEIFWVQGLRIGERFKLTPQTVRQLVWKESDLAV